MNISISVNTPLPVNISGFDLLDDCNSLTRAVHQALDFADCRDSYNTSSDLRLGKPTSLPLLYLIYIYIYI